MADTYHRRASPTQTKKVAEQVLSTKELWGQTPSWGARPAVQAWEGPLPPGTSGFEFTTKVPPDPSSLPSLPTWRGPRPGVDLFTDEDGVEWAKIPVVVTKVLYEGEDS